MDRSIGDGDVDIWNGESRSFVDDEEILERRRFELQFWVFGRDGGFWLGDIDDARHDRFANRPNDACANGTIETTEMCR